MVVLCMEPKRASNEIQAMAPRSDFLKLRRHIHSSTIRGSFYHRGPFRQRGLREEGQRSSLPCPVSHEWKVSLICGLLSYLPLSQRSSRCQTCGGNRRGGRLQVELPNNTPVTLGNLLSPNTAESTIWLGLVISCPPVMQAVAFW